MNGNQTALRAVPRDSLARLQNRIGFEVVLVYLPKEPCCVNTRQGPSIT